MKIKNLPIGTRLGFGFGLVLVLATFSSGIGLWRLNEVASNTRAMMQEPLKKERMTEEWYRVTVSGLKRTLAIVKSSDESLSDFFAGDVKASTGRNSEIQKYMEEHIGTPDEKKLLDNIVVVRKQYIVLRDLIVKAKKDGQADEVAKLFEKFMPMSDAYQKSELDFLEFQVQQVDNLSKDVDAIATNSRILISTLIVTFILFGSLCAWYLTHGITQPMNNAVTLARNVADGDLTSHIEVNSTDETGQLMQALKDMNDGLQKIVAEVRDSTDTIVTASTEIAAGNMDLSSRTESQAGSLEETASSMEELTSTMQQNSQNAKEANNLANAASEAAVKGGSVVSQVVDTMGSISASSKKIVDIIAVIDGIAFQTNILALNAAVEAARAGEQGRGFAVVASEVRNLAQRSASAAKEIKELIADSVEKVDEGARLVDQAGATMTEIVQRVAHVTNIMSEINNASNEQSAGINQINQAIIQMDNVTQQNAALVEEAAAAAQSLQDQASNLSNVVSIFKINRQASYAAPAAASRPVKAAAVSRNRVTYQR
ncbi:methyl-accepting chemotaxis protein [Undibacterium sp. Ji50W]|uniref:methyl-accepting chemotaxis protein n=1 Tax=Undibacterium sp. Ji50W TaxID=3413041 RepID=UPI003BF3705D